ncbi:hypothetical protein RDWZM_000353 [Blomia tropicalis]|uniref:Uncharacterized protein n=1 Tax=Blomia tropicalis TaxID=40697 RepID=A0A9Q0M8M4_BLOTA|nr:hypothetical protein RDWZM_000353 [Blomia tropicalis]
MLHLFNISSNFAFIIRFGYTIITHFNPKYAITDYDVFVRIFDFNSNDFSMIATFIGLSISTALLEAKLYFSRIDTVTWQMFYDLVVRNADICKRCMKSEASQAKTFNRRLDMVRKKLAKKHSTSVWWFNPYSRMKASGSIWWNLDYINKFKLSQTKLSQYPEISFRLRTMMIIELNIANVISSTLITSLYVSFGALVILYFLELIQFFPVWYLPIVLLELSYFAYMLIRVLEILIFQTNLASSSAILFISYIMEANNFLKQTLREERQRHVPRKMGNSLRIFMKKHTHITHQIIYANHEMWGTVLLISMLNHIPNNAYMLFRVISGSNAMLTWIMMIVQIFYILVTLLFLAAYSKVLHQAKVFLMPAQSLIDREQLNAKWKCLMMYELLNNSSKIGITIGPSSTITYRLVFEIVFYYNEI